MKSSQRGYTFLELLLVLAIDALIGVVIVSLIFQTSKITVGQRTQILIAEDVSAVPISVLPDIRYAETATVSGSNRILTLDWKQYYDNGNYLQTPIVYSIVYSFSGNTLTSTKNKDGLTIRVKGVKTPFLTDVRFYVDGSIIKAVVTSSPQKGLPGSPVSLTYQFYLEPKVALVN